MCWAVCYRDSRACGGGQNAGARSAKAVALRRGVADVIKAGAPRKITLPAPAPNPQQPIVIPSDPALRS